MGRLGVFLKNADMTKVYKKDPREHVMSYLLSIAHNTHSNFKKRSPIE